MYFFFYRIHRYSVLIRHDVKIGKKNVHKNYINSVQPYSKNHWSAAADAADGQAVLADGAAATDLITTYYLVLSL